MMMKPYILIIYLLMELYASTCCICSALMYGLLYYYLAAIAYNVLTRVLSSMRPAQTLKDKKLMVVFGSGGHTTEMLLMLTKANLFQFEKYGRVQFVIGHSDTWSLTKIKDFMSRGKEGF